MSSPSGCCSQDPKSLHTVSAAIDLRVRDSGRRFRVIPVLLPGAGRAERSSLPTFQAAATWVEFRDSLDDPAAFHRLMCGIRGIEPGPDPGQALYEGQCPYRGLRVFDVDDVPFFFGREALAQWLLNELRPAAEGQPVNRFLAIVGSSGSGKSSVARAGLVAVRNFLYAAKVAQGQTLVTLTMRADFYGKCAANAELAAAFSDHHVLVGPMAEEELRRAIEMPERRDYSA